MGATMRREVDFRALAPGEQSACRSADDVVAVFRRWFAGETRIELLALDVSRVVDRIGFGYRLRLHGTLETRLVEQRAFADVDDARFASLDVLCSGFRPECLAGDERRLHQFDAGTLGCGTGLPREFRARIGSIPVGHMLEVVARDASAREDLPALARMLGHRVDAVESGADGTITIRVERAR